MWNIRRTISKGDYIYAIVPEHPNRTSNNYVLYHRIIVENHLGRLLTSDEVVHHRDEDKSNNEISNLEVMTKKEHSQHHADLRLQMIFELKCPHCRQIFLRRKGQMHLGKKQSFTACSSSCRGSFSRKKQLFKLNQFIVVAQYENIVRSYYGKM